MDGRTYRQCKNSIPPWNTVWRVYNNTNKLYSLSVAVIGYEYKKFTLELTYTLQTIKLKLMWKILKSGSC